MDGQNKLTAYSILAAANFIMSLRNDQVKNIFDCRPEDDSTYVVSTAVIN